MGKLDLSLNMRLLVVVALALCVTMAVAESEIDFTGTPFEGKTLDQVKAYFNVQVSKDQPIGMVGPEEMKEIQKEIDELKASLPTTYLAADHYPKCGNLLSPSGIENQEKCGSCWAFSATEVLADELCFGGGPEEELSAQDLVSCDYTNMGCNGGILANAWKWMTDHGVTTWDCLPYTSGNGTTGSCPARCADGSPIKRFYATDARHVTSLFGKAEKIYANLVEHGVAQAAFSVFSDFMAYSGGIYTHKSGSLLGGHAVKIVGAGNVQSGKCVAGSQSWDCANEKEGAEFWVVANSWGTSWGLDGFFLMARDGGNCGFNNDVWSGVWNGKPAH